MEKADDDDESPEERQEAEVEALKAIYEGDFEDLREKDVWKVSRPPEFTLRLVPNHDSKGLLEQHVHVVLKIKMSEDYPRSPPCVIAVQESKGLSDDLVAVLQAQLQDRAQQLVGEVMITDLAQMTASWLSGHNKPSFASFYEEMEANRRVKLQKEEETLAREKRMSSIMEKKEQEAVREEVAKNMEMIKEERQRLKEQERKRHLGQQQAEEEDVGCHDDVVKRSSRTSRRMARSTSVSESGGSDHVR